MNWHDYFKYDGENLLWKKKIGKVKVGDTAGTLAKGYIQIRLNGKFYMAHRIIWEMANGIIPNGMQIDHINHIRNDNRLMNLRLVSAKVNSRNMSKKTCNTSGLTGVYYASRYVNPWRALIRVDGKRVTLGSFATKEEAKLARKNAEIKYGFHPNHGR